GSDSDPLVVEQGGQIVRMNFLDRDADNRAAVLDRRAVNRDARRLVQQSQRTLQQLVLLSMDRVKAQRLDVVDGRSQPDRLADRKRSRFKLGGQFAPR